MVEATGLETSPVLHTFQQVTPVTCDVISVAEAQSGRSETFHSAEEGSRLVP